MSLTRRRVARALRARYGVSTPEAAERTREALEYRRREVQESLRIVSRNVFHDLPLKVFHELPFYRTGGR